MRDVDFDLRPGEFVLVAGPSGCGKSTLLRCLNGLIPRSYHGSVQGEVFLFGQATAGLELHDISIKVGTVLQDPDKQLVAANVRADIAFGLENQAVARATIRERVGEASQALGLEPLLDRPPAALSGGERQKVALAGVLAMRPQVMLLDEPLASLDPQTAIELLRFLSHRKQDGLAVLVVEHRVEDVLEVHPDRVVYMEEGQITYDGAADGFLRVADPAAVKLPFEAVLERRKLGHAHPTLPRKRGREMDPVPRERGRETDALVAYEGVRYSYPGADRPAVDGVTAQLGTPERVAILGPNGSGKSTLLKLALALVRPQQGTVRVGGHDAREQTVAQLSRQVAYVFQSPRQMLFANSVREELAFAPRNLGMSRDQTATVTASALGLVGLDTVEGIWERSPYSLSFGQQKRLAIAAALSMQPQAIVVDEPSAGQDYGQAAAFLSEIDRIPGLESVYFITHDIDLALLFADRCLLFKDGRLQDTGPPLEVLANPQELERMRLRPSSLLRANLAMRVPGGRALDAEQLAELVIGRSRLEPN